MTTFSSSPQPPEQSGHTPAISNPVDSELVNSRYSKLEEEITDLRDRNNALADAVINSAEIIDELEQTKQKLAEAQKAAEQAHQNTQLMAETIFEETHDAILVLDKSMGFISANRNAREMFQLNCHDQCDVLEQIKQTYFSEQYQDCWLEVLTSDLTQPRLELYKLEDRTPAPQSKQTTNDFPNGVGFRFLLAHCETINLKSNFC